MPDSQKLESVCSVRHLYGLDNATDTKSLIKAALKASCAIGLDSVAPLTSKSLLFPYSHHYRYLIAFTSVEQQIYIVPVLKAFGFTPLTEYQGYQGKPVTIWGLSIPEYVDRTGKLE